MPRGNDINLTAGYFRLNLGTILVLLGLIGSWYDSRTQAERRDAVQQVRSEAVTETLAEMKRLQALQQYDINSIKLTLAENGIKVKKAE